MLLRRQTCDTQPDAVCGCVSCCEMCLGVVKCALSAPAVMVMLSVMTAERWLCSCMHVAVLKRMWSCVQANTHRQGSQMSAVSRPLGPNHATSSEASAGLRQTAPTMGMQLPLGSVITNPPIQPLAHHSSQLQSQPVGAHFQHLPSSRAYQVQSFPHALTEASHPLTAQSMHSMPSHGLGQGFPQPQGLFSQPLLAQGPGMTTHGFSQPLPTQSFFPQPHSSQGFYTQGQNASARTGQAILLQPPSGPSHGSLSLQGSANSSLPDGVAHGQSLPDGSAHLPSI